MKKLLAGIVFAVAAAMLFVSCGGAAGGNVEFRLVNESEPSTLDMTLASNVSEHRISLALFEGLVTNDPKTADAVPAMAEKWEISADGTEYTFHLRDAKWSDGQPVTAQDFVDSWYRILDPATAAQYAWFPAMFIAGAADYNAAKPEDAEKAKAGVQIKAIDAKTFWFKTVGPMPYVLGALTHYSFGVFPMHVINKLKAAGKEKEWTLPENMVTNGPYVLKEWKPQDHITVTKSSTYWDAANVKVDTITYLPIDDNNTGYNMFVNGEIDWQPNVALDKLDAAKQRKDYNVAPQLSTYYYIFENKVKPLNDKRVRQALSLAVDRQKLVDLVTKAGQIPAFGMVPSMAGYDSIPGLGFDVEKAKKLLADAGFPGGKGFPTFELSYNTSENHQKIAEYIQQTWKEVLGINVTLKNSEFQTFLATRREHNFQIARSGWVGDYKDPNTFLDMFITGGGLNDGEYSNAEYDALVKKAATLPDGPDRFATLKQAETILIDEQGVMPLYFYTSNNMVDTSKWGGWYPNIMDYHPPKFWFKK